MGRVLNASAHSEQDASGQTLGLKVHRANGETMPMSSATETSCQPLLADNIVDSVAPSTNRLAAVAAVFRAVFRIRVDRRRTCCP